MAVVTKGIGVRWGTQTGVAITGVVFTGYSYAQSADLTITPNKQEMLNQYGQKVGLSYVDYEKTMTITVVPGAVGATAIADSATEAGKWLPAAGTAVELSNGGTARIATTWIDWVVTGARVRESNTGPIMIEMDLLWLEGISGADTSWDDIAI